MIELLPCPFCGSKAIAYFDQQDNIATCTNEDCPAMPGSVGNKTLQEARDKWNTRTARPEEALDEMSKIAEHIRSEAEAATAPGNYFTVRLKAHLWKQVADALQTPVPEVAMHQWIEAEKAKADAYESAANICEEMSYPPEGRDRWANKEEEWAAIKLEDAAKAIRERKAKVCHVTQAAVSPLGRPE